MFIKIIGEEYDCKDTGILYITSLHTYHDCSKFGTLRTRKTMKITLTALHNILEKQ